MKTVSPNLASAAPEPHYPIHVELPPCTLDEAVLRLKALAWVLESRKTDVKMAFKMGALHMDLAARDQQREVTGTITIGTKPPTLSG